MHLCISYKKIIFRLGENTESLTIKQLENYLALKYKDRSDSTGLFMKLIEEIGETAEVLNQLEGRKKQGKDVSLEKELVDIIHYTVAIAAVNEIDLSSAILYKDKVASVKYNQKSNLIEYLEQNS